MIVINLLYILSNEACVYNYESPNVCNEYFKKMYAIWVLEDIIVGFLWFFLMIAVIHKVISKVWVLFLAANFVFILFYMTGMEWADHGAINRFVFLCTITVLFAIYGIARAFVKIWKFNRLVFHLVIFGVILCFFTFYEFRIKDSCGDWAKGLGNHRMVNDDNQCKMPIPTYCELDTRSGWLDFARFGSKCANKPMTLESSMLSADMQGRTGVSKIGFPRIEDYPDELKINQTAYKNYVQEHLIDMDDPTVPQSVKDNIEYVVDISDPYEHKLEFTFKPNATRSAEQKQLREQVVAQEKENGTYSNRLDKNVLILYMDNLSRAHFNRKMPKTAEWLGQYVDNQESEYATYQYFRFHPVFYNTLITNNAMYYGAVEQVEDTSTNVFDSFSENGYMTGFFKDSCETNSNSIYAKNLKLHRWDHFGGSIA